MISKERLSKLFLIGIVAFIIGAFLYGRFINAPKFEEKGKYTIGIFENFKSKRGGLYSIKYSFMKDNKMNFGEANYSENRFEKSFVGKRFLVVYVENEDYLSSLLLEYPVPDSIQSAPPEGWKELPNWAKKK